jgi:peptidoglycan hydrolase CwlO-like protein
MNAFTPIDLHGGYDVLTTLLAVIKDPDAHKARLDEQIAQQKAIDDKIAALNEMSANTRRLNTAAEDLTIVLNKRKTALDAREAELDKRKAELDERTKHLDLHSTPALQRRENAVAAREEAAVRETERLAAMRTDYEGKHARIKGLADTLHH